MSSRQKVISKKRLPSESVYSETSEDDLLGKGDGKSKKMPKKSIKESSSSLRVSEVVEDHENSKNDHVTKSSDVKILIPEKNENLISLVAQLHKKDDQIGKLSESVSCMAKEIQKLNNVILKLQDQLTKIQENGQNANAGEKQVRKSQTSTSSTLNAAPVPFSKVEPAKVKKTASSVQDTPFSKVLQETVKKTVKFADVAKRATPKKLEPQELLNIKNSKWVGKQVLYLVSFADTSIPDRWLSLNEFQADRLIEEFYSSNPGAASTSDYVEKNQWISNSKKEKNVQKKISKNAKLSDSDIQFIAQELTTAKSAPKEFTKLHFRIANKRVLQKCSYKDKQKVILRILHSYGVAGFVVRASFIGNSILEFYVLKESEAKFKTAMKRNEWELEENFDYYQVPYQTEKKQEECLAALVQRLGFLRAGTKLVNLKECILIGLNEETIELILKKEEEILESREGQRTAYVRTNQ